MGGSFFLPRHPNVAVQTAGTIVQRGFFPVDLEAAGRHAKAYLFDPRLPVIYVPSVVEEDSLQGNCNFVNVTQDRHETVKDRMLRTVNTNPPWDRYRGIKRNSIDWANEVLK